MALEAGSAECDEAASDECDECVDGHELHWAVTNHGQFVDGKFKDPGGFTLRYCRDCSIGLCVNHA